MHLEIVLGFLPIEYLLTCIPFQHYMPLSRFQHYSFAIFAAAFSFLLQGRISYKTLSTWGRIALFGSAAYLFTFALTLYMNPWMDADATMNTLLQLEFRRNLFAAFIVAAVPLTTAWFHWGVEKEREHRASDRALRQAAIKADRADKEPSSEQDRQEGPSDSESEIEKVSHQ